MEATAAYDRSVTPAMSNNNHRYASAPRMGMMRAGTEQPHNDSYRSITPNGRGMSETPSNGLIRLSLKKPMGIVFEPMYDPNNSAVQRGVRICDLPRTGAAALSRQLQVGDELLQINDTTVSRLTFDEIMDFIIEADPESVNLLFRRPRKETLQARIGMPQKLNAAANKDTPATVKWDLDKPKKKKKKQQSKQRPKKGSVSEEDETLQSKQRAKKGSVSEEDETLQSKGSTVDDSYVKRRTKKKGRSKNRTYENESFLDMLIDSICADPQNVCRDTFRRDDYSEDESFVTEEGTYETYDKTKESTSKKYEDDGTLESVETRDLEQAPKPKNTTVPPLGLAPNPQPKPMPVMYDEPSLDGNNPAPIKELEYDDRIDHGADVSVMESLGGPSLLIEKQRAAQLAASQQIVPSNIVENYGLDFPPTIGMTREKSIQTDPLRFYTFVVKQLLQQHEPEKVRLLDKLLAKYKGREDHLVQKLSVRYAKETEDFTEKVVSNKKSEKSEQVVKEVHEQFEDDKAPDDEVSESGSEYSRDSVDGTSPAVIAQVSELLNYVYGKTSVPGQIDRVSTIMRAYEGREAVLLELLETKALIKANKEKENADNLPSFLRNSQLSPVQEPEEPQTTTPVQQTPVTPMVNNPINDDISSMSGVSSPVVEKKSPTKEKKKKGLFGGLFKKKETPSRLRRRRNDNSGI